MKAKPEIVVTEVNPGTMGKKYHIDGFMIGRSSHASFIIDVATEEHPRGFCIHWNIGPKRHELAKELLAKQP